ncbi:hypothetical protein BCV70DRAFT_219676 [Testicularia cyperi]|uniref:Uncharacterized protein n=1 Tax=Testicularia cyperi TaxID=1882483 RepID=A0A317XH38_9BASI|nr:hypothetical protein BCV70DRAFT_219676 [Testicularia cyperi]
MSRPRCSLWPMLMAVVIALLGSVLAIDEIVNPNVAAALTQNCILTDNTKQVDLTCCMGIPYVPKDGQGYNCSPQTVNFATGPTPQDLQVGQTYCFTNAHVDPKVSTDEMNKKCTDQQGIVISPENGRCPIFPNYSPGYKAPGYRPPPDSTTGSNPPPATTDPKTQQPPVREDGTNTNAGTFVTKGTFNYALIDNGVTRALACCKASSTPIMTPNNYICAQRQISNEVFKHQCAAVVMSVTHAGQLTGYTTIDDGGQIVDDATKQTCQSWWTAASSYTYGFCRLKFETAAPASIQAFQADCQANGGTLKDPHSGLCLWNADDSASSSTTS